MAELSGIGMYENGRLSTPGYLNKVKTKEQI